MQAGMLLFTGTSRLATNEMFPINPSCGSTKKLIASSSIEIIILFEKIDRFLIILVKSRA